MAAMLLSAIIASVSVLYFSLKSILLLTAVGLITIFYALPLPFTNKFRLRDIGLMKPVFVGFVWATVSVILPLMESGFTDSFQIAALFLNRFLFVTAITLPFDIRDLQFDKSNLRFPTLPMIAGVQTTIILSFLALLFSMLPLFYLFENFSVAIIIGIAIWYVLTFVLIIVTNKKSAEFHYTFLLDGTLVAGMLIFIFTA